MPCGRDVVKVWGIDMARINSRTTFLIFLGALMVGFVAMMQRFLIPAGLAIVTAILLQPWYDRIVARMPKHRHLAALLTVGLTIILILGPFGTMIATIVLEVFHFLEQGVRYLQQGGFNETLGAANQYVDRLPEAVRSLLGPNLDLRVTAISLGRELARWIYQWSPQVLGSFVHLAFGAIMWLLLLFFCFADGPHLYRVFMELFPAAPRHQAHLARHVREMVFAVFLGMLSTSAVNGVLMASAFAVAGLDNPLMWGLITFGFSFIPIIGAFLVWGGAALYLLLSGHWPAALGMALFGLVIVGQADNIIKPLVMRGTVNIHPVLLFLSILGGLEFMGPTGLIFGPVLVALVLASLQIYREEYALTDGE